MMNFFSRRRSETVMERLERRASRRSPAGFRAHVRSATGPAVARSEPAVVHDISTGGLALITDMRIDRGDDVLLGVLFPGESEPTDVELHVVEARRLITREYIANCAFGSIAPHVRQLVEDWTEARGA